MKGRKRGIDEWGRAVCLIWLESEVTSVRQKQTFWTNPSGRAEADAYTQTDRQTDTE